MLKIVNVQYSTKSAGRSAVRLNNGFLKSGIDSSILSLNYGENDPGEIKYVHRNSRIIAWLDTKIQNFLTRNSIKKFGAFSYPIFGTDISKLEQIKEADIIYLHWTLGGFLNVSNLESLAKLNKPIIFIMHDMWAITGGCHHSFTCGKYMTGCGACPMLPKHKKKDLSSRLFAKKMKFYSKYKNIHFISPSKWLYNCAKQSLLLRNHPISYIPNVIDSNIFRPVNKIVARQFLGLSPTDNIIVFGAVSVSNPYKGWVYLEKALNLLKDSLSYDNTTVLIFGSGYKKELAEAIPFKTKFTGFLSDEYSMILLYNAADILVTPSLADNQPTTVMESLCCGAAVVGFEVGGIPDMISHKENGYLAKYLDAGDIARGIKFCLDNKLSGFQLPDFKSDLILQKHLSLIDQIKHQ